MTSAAAAHSAHRWATDPQYRERRKATLRRWRSANTERVREYERRRLADPEIRARRYLQARARRYGLTLAELEQMLAVKRCAACGKVFDDVNRKRVIDHEHITRKVRGVICEQCNYALGFAGDDVEVLRGLIGYLSGQLRLL